jgi:hypothetical protein
MIVFIGDWVKALGKWGQVVAVDPTCDMFATIGVDGERVWWGTSTPELFEGFLSNLEMQEKLEGLA